MQKMTIGLGWRRWVAPALMAAALGCGGGPGEPTAAGPGDAGARSRRVLDDMGQPDAALVVSGQIDGYLEPCGCARGQAGGLARRYELVERLRGQGWPLALIDLGGLVGDPSRGRSGSSQSRIKARYILEAIDLLKYDAIALNPDDLGVGVEEALTSYRDELVGPTRVVAANVEPAGAFAETIRPGVVIAVGSLKLGVTSAVDPASLAGLDDKDKARLLPAVRPIEEDLPRVLADLESRSDYQVLMVQGNYEFAGRIAEANPGFDVVIATSEGIGAASRHPGVLNGGRTTLVGIGRRGFHVGVFAFHRDRRPTYHLVALNDLYDGPAAAMNALIRDRYRAALEAARVVEDFPRTPAPGPEGSAYVGARTCAVCHPNTFQKWSTTRHAQAFASLQHDPRPKAVFDAECVSCHTTGFPHVSGWRSESATPYLAGNQCENCHGPGSRHAAEPDHAAFRPKMAATTDQARLALCARCHDHDNSPSFDLGRYWSQVAHKGLDDYNDPRVHRGLAERPGPTPAEILTR